MGICAQILMSVRQALYRGYLCKKYDCCPPNWSTVCIFQSQHYIHRCLSLHLWPCNNKICYHLGSSYSFGEPVYLAWCLSSWVSQRLYVPVVSQAIAAVNTTHFSSIACWHFFKNCHVRNTYWLIHGNWIMTCEFIDYNYFILFNIFSTTIVILS